MGDTESRLFAQDIFGKVSVFVRSVGTKVRHSVPGLWLSADDAFRHSSNGMQWDFRFSKFKDDPDGSQLVSLVFSITDGNLEQANLSCVNVAGQVLMSVPVGRGSGLTMAMVDSVVDCILKEFL